MWQIIIIWRVYKMLLGYDYQKSNKGLRFKNVIFDLNTSEEVKENHINKIYSVQKISKMNDVQCN